MVRIAPVRLQYNPKTLWFDPGELSLSLNDPVIVSTERGSEFGYTDGIIEVDESELSQLKSPLKPVLRKASPEDLDRIEELKRKSAEALPRFRELAREAHENMNPVMVEYLFDEDKAIFFFESEERIDFRDLVRKLAQEFHVRVDMRQIGVRDEARLLGGIGHCGQELCCKRMGGEFNPVTIRMAKEQDLSLNPQKISGVCGRLMCCLRYEYEAYKDFKGRAPKLNATIQTPCGCCKVCDHDVPRERITVKMDEDNKRVTFPLAEMDEPKEGQSRPSSIGDVFEKYLDPEVYISTLTPVGGSTGYDRSAFTREDTLAKPGAISHNHMQSTRTSEDEMESTSKKSSRRRHDAKSSKSRRGNTSTNKGSTNHETGRERSNRRREQVAFEPTTTRRVRRRHTSQTGAEMITQGAQTEQVLEHTHSSRVESASYKRTHRTSNDEHRDVAPRNERTRRRRTHANRTSPKPSESTAKPSIRPGQRASSVVAFHERDAASPQSSAPASGERTQRRRSRTHRTSGGVHSNTPHTNAQKSAPSRSSSESGPSNSSGVSPNRERTRRRRRERSTHTTDSSQD